MRRFRGQDVQRARQHGRKATQATRGTWGRLGKTRETGKTRKTRKNCKDTPVEEEEKRANKRGLNEDQPKSLDRQERGRVKWRGDSVCWMGWDGMHLGEKRE
jgi:hypothetical protein